MPLLKRELHQAAKGPVMNDEDWWRLVFDTDANRLYVEHEWQYVDVQRKGEANHGQIEMDVTSFLNKPEQGMAHQKLLHLLSRLFEDKLDA